MEIKVKKEKEPELKLKKEAQVTVHKKNPILSAKEKKAAFTSKPVADLLGQRKKKEGAEKGKQPEQDREALFEKQKEKKKQAGKEAAIRGAAEGRKQNGKPKGTVSVPGTLQTDQMKQGAAPNSQPSAGFRAKEEYRREQAVKLAETKKSSLAKQTAIKGVRRGEAAILTQLEGGEEVNDSLYVMGTAAKPAEKLWKDRNYRKAEQELKVKQADGKITNKQFYKETKAVKKKQMEKQKKQAVRQRKIQYMINKLTGNGQQDSLAQVAKDIVKMKASVFMLKVVQFAGALLAPLFSILLVVAIPVVIIFFLLYCSPLGAFMPNPSEENPTVREVLSGYYMDFNTKLGQNGEDGAVTYLHEKNGNYESNYYDTLMVYMVKYGTGDMGVDMDQRHKDKLKEIFDEMNSFENTTITTTIKAGESLGNVVTSGYCQCSICCGQWAGGPTASGVMPKPDHTLAVDAQNPFVPMGTRIIMNGIEYTVEDTGAFDRYGVQFDVFCADHATDGISAAKRIRTYDKNVRIIYVTSHESYMRESFEVRPFQFLVKPVTDKIMEKCFKSVYEDINSEDFYFRYSYQRMNHKVPIKDILYFESNKRKIFIVTEQEILELYGKLNEIEETLKTCKISFLRVHQSFLVNYKHISGQSYDSVVMDNGQKISISEDRRKIISEQYCSMEDTFYVDE